MLILFVIAIFSGASLLFLVQPMIAKELLPMLGGSPAVWNTCMVFFQVALLGGYLYAHLLAKLKSCRVELIVHVCVMVVAAITLPIGIGENAAPDQSPNAWALTTLATSVGAPFFVLASASPLLQRWFAGTNHRWASDPYFLYAASNAGSMLALLGYPFLVEPNLAIPVQLDSWSIGFGVFALLALACGRLASSRGTAQATSQQAEEPRSTGVSVQQRLLWIALAFVPSSLMLGVTQHVTTDIATTPLFWVIPLAIYLGTFVVAFTSWGRPVTRGMEALVPVVAVTIATVMTVGWKPIAAAFTDTAGFKAITAEFTNNERAVLLIAAVHLSALAVIALACHGRLARERPHASRLTEFYLLVSVGGALGGVFNALLAPVVFDWVAEYPIAIVAACILRPTRKRTNKDGKTVPRNPLVPTLTDVVAILFILFVFFGMEPQPFATGVAFVTAAVCLFVASGRWRFVVAVSILFAAPEILNLEDRLHRERTFFGVYKVVNEQSGTWYWHHLYHGTTLHGSQYTQEPWASQTTVYYTKTGPIGDILTATAQKPGPIHLACVGLGSGTLASAGREGWKMTFYEIDPEVVKIATNPELFTNIQNSKAEIDFFIGDARLQLAKTGTTYTAIILDAFSSDAIPVHLITKEAVELYLQRLAPGGILAFHVTNRYLQLTPVLAGIAADLGLVAAARNDSVIDEDDKIQRKKTKTKYVVLARRAPDLGPIEADQRWLWIKKDPKRRTWTDDYSNILEVLK